MAIPCASLVLLLAVSGCSSRERQLDPQARWDSAEKRLDEAYRSIEDVQRLRGDYEAIAVVANDNDLRARALQRLAEIDLALDENAAAARHLRCALAAGPSGETRPRILLALGDVLGRRMRDRAEGERAYRSIVEQYPESPEAVLAGLRLETLDREWHEMRPQ